MLIHITLLLFQFGVNSSTIHVIKLMPNSPAQVAGIKADDVFLSINGQKIQRTEDGQRIIRESTGKPLAIQVARRSGYRSFDDFAALKTYLDKDYKEGNFIRFHASQRKFPVVFDNQVTAENYLKTLGSKKLKVDVSTTVETIDIAVKPDKTGKIGVHITPYFLDDRLMTYPFAESLEKATIFTIQMTKILFVQISEIVVNIATKFKAPEGIGGPVAIANAVSQTVDKGWHSFFELAAQICLSIGVFNLIPIPGLDGGRIFVIVTKEIVNWFSRKVFGRAKEAFDDVMEGYINIFGVLCVLSLIVIVTYQDIQAVLR